MKKLILTSAAILFVSMASIAQDASKDSKKIVKKEHKECMKEDGTCAKKCGPGECAKDAKCKESKSCAKHCSMDEKK